MSIRHLFTNIVCGLVPNKKSRSKLRVVLNNPKIHKYIKYVRHWADKNCGGVQKIRIEFGVGCHNLVVILNDAHVFKFFLVPGREARAYHEARVVTALRNISPIRFPEMELIKYDNSVLRRYEFITGKMLTDFTPEQVQKNRTKIARQLANFLYVIGCADPEEIRDLKPVAAAQSGYLYGWFHNDIGNNFMLDDDFNIVGFIDCERADFCDFRRSLIDTEHFWNKQGYRGLMVELLAEYSKLYYSHKTKVKK